MGAIDIYEVKFCSRGRREQQDARFVAAEDTDEAAYKVVGEHLHSEANAGRFGYASGGLATEVQRRSCFTPREAVISLFLISFIRAVRVIGVGARTGVRITHDPQWLVPPIDRE